MRISPGRILLAERSIGFEGEGVSIEWRVETGRDGVFGGGGPEALHKKEGHKKIP
jgi:hypothetical protein